jgi:hypothetical protein
MFEQIASFVARNVRTEGLFASDEQFDLACRMYDLAQAAGYRALETDQAWYLYQLVKLA